MTGLGPRDSREVDVVQGPQGGGAQWLPSTRIARFCAARVARATAAGKGGEGPGRQIGGGARAGGGGVAIG